MTKVTMPLSTTLVVFYTHTHYRFSHMFVHHIGNSDTNNYFHSYGIANCSDQ